MGKNPFACFGCCTANPKVPKKNKNDNENGPAIVAEGVKTV